MRKDSRIVYVHRQQLSAILLRTTLEFKFITNSIVGVDLHSRFPCQRDRTCHGENSNNHHTTGAEPNERDNHQATPMHYAASNGQREVIAVLMSFGGDVSAVDQELDTPLHHATRQRKRIAMSLLESAGADPGAVNCWGLLAGTLAPEYKMHPAAEENDVGVPPCVACSAKKGFHYYFCRSEILEETPEGLVLGADGLPAVGGGGTAKAKHGRA